MCIRDSFQPAFEGPNVALDGSGKDLGVGCAEGAAFGNDGGHIFGWGYVKGGGAYWATTGNASAIIVLPVGGYPRKNRDDIEPGISVACVA